MSKNHHRVFMYSLKRPGDSQIVGASNDSSAWRKTPKEANYSSCFYTALGRFRFNQHTSAFLGIKNLLCLNSSRGEERIKVVLKILYSGP